MANINGVTRFMGNLEFEWVYGLDQGTLTSNVT